MQRHTTPPPPSSPPPRILRRHEVAERTGLSARTVHELMVRGDFPQSFALGDRAVGWLQRDIDAWIMARASRAPLGMPAACGEGAPA